MINLRQLPPQSTAYSSAAIAMNSAAAAHAQLAELALVHQHILETANKRISTLEYLRKTHQGRVYWFNTLLFDKPDLNRMPYFDARRLGRRATNYLLLGLSLPAVVDLNSHSPTDFLRALSILLSEFETFQSIHSETGSTASSLSRARLPQMFRRSTAGSRGRRTSGAANDVGYPLEHTDSSGSGGAGGGGSSNGGAGAVLTPSASSGSFGPGGGPAAPPSSVMNFGPGENDLLPGKEYTLLMTPGLPFDPDFFETFATLCDVLIDFYTRLLSLLPAPRDCAGPIAELFTKVDGKIRKLIVQGFVKEFEDSSRSGIKTEVANVGKVMLSGLM